MCLDNAFVWLYNNCIVIKRKCVLLVIIFLKCVIRMYLIFFCIIFVSFQYNFFTKGILCPNFPFYIEQGSNMETFFPLFPSNPLSSTDLSIM